MKRRARLALAAAALATALVPASAHAASITVNTPSDAPAVGDCGLRNAITAANTDAAVGGCATGSGDDDITVPADNYTLSDPAGSLDVSSNLTITGDGRSTTTIDANETDRVLEVASGVTVELEKLTLTGGHPPDGAPSPDAPPGTPGAPGSGAAGGPSIAGGGNNAQGGGGIRNEGNLTLTDVAVSGNRADNGGDGGDGGAGGAGGSGPTSQAGGIGGPSFGGSGGNGGDGGGIWSSGTLTLEDSSGERQLRR